MAAAYSEVKRGNRVHPQPLLHLLQESEIPYHAYSGSKVEVSGGRLYHFVVADWLVAT